MCVSFGMCVDLILSQRIAFARFAVLAILAAVLLSGLLSWTYWTYEHIPHLVTIEQAAAQQPYDYIIGKWASRPRAVQIERNSHLHTHSGRWHRWMRARQPP